MSKATSPKAPAIENETDLAALGEYDLEDDDYEYEGDPGDEYEDGPDRIRALLNRNVARSNTPIAVFDLLGHLPAELFTFICYAMVSSKYSRFIVEDKYGKAWLRQPLPWIEFRIGLTTDERLVTARDKLVKLGLIQVEQYGMNRSTRWRPCYEKAERFIRFAYALRNATAPVNFESLTKWLAFAKENPELVKEFAHLVPKEQAKKIPVIKTMTGKHGNGQC